MSASGAFSTKSIEINAVITQKQAHQQLYKAFEKESSSLKKTLTKSYWSLRESSIEGMVTVDFISFVKGKMQRPKSLRLALIQEPGNDPEIRVAHGKSLETLAPGSILIEISRRTLKSKRSHYLDLLCQFVEKNYQLTVENYVAANLALIARNKVRDLAIMLNQPRPSQEFLSQTQFLNFVFDKMSDITTCALLSEPLLGDRAAILPSGNLVSAGALLKSTVGRRKSEDPFTRQPMKPEDVLWINDFENLNLDVSDTTFLPKCG